MEKLKRFAASPFALFGFLLLGAVAGLLTPDVSGYASVVAQLYLSVVSMAALPLTVVATFFGLRQTLLLPLAGRRILMISTVGVALIVACSAVGAGVGFMSAAGRNLSANERQHLGGLVQKAGGGAANAEMNLMDKTDAAKESEGTTESRVPNNYFRALVEGKATGIMLCSILFGLAFAALSKERTNALATIFEAIYRTFETIIASANIFIPVLVFGMAAFFVSTAERQTMTAMGGFMLSFVFVTLLLAGLAVEVIRRNARVSGQEVLSALKAPILVSLTSASSTASIPGTIFGMSARLGFSRGIVELVTPISAVFLRAGAALYFALAAVFIANLYGRSLGFDDFMLIVLGASLAALASAGTNSIANAAYTAMVLGMLSLPIEAALALFIAVDVLCEGPRNLLGMLFSCMLIALVSQGLPSERQAAKALAPPAVASTRFSFKRSDLVLLGAGMMLVGALIVLLGIGFGIRSNCEPSAATQLQLGGEISGRSVR